MKKTILIITSTLLQAITYGQTNPSNVNRLACPSHDFSPYEPKEPSSMNDLPDTIRTKLESHLIDRLGPAFYSKLVFNKGQIVDLEELYKINANAKNYKWTPYSYYLCFSLPNKEQFFTAHIVLDKYGNVKEEIDLPDIKNNPYKENILTFELAKSIAKKNKCYNNKTATSLEYDSTTDLLEWHFYFSNGRYYKDGSHSSILFIINAHDGSIISKRKRHHKKKFTE